MTNPSLLIVPDRFKASKLYSQLPQDGSGDFVVTRATTAYRTNAAGILESVANNVPRLDFPSGSGCPALLVEPGATNLVLHNNDFGNAYWTKVNTTTASSADPVVGTQWQVTDSLDILPQIHYVWRNAGITGGTTACGSKIYAKAGTLSRIRLSQTGIPGAQNSNQSSADINLSNGQVIQSATDATFVSVKPMINGWYEIEVGTNGTLTNSRYSVIVLNNLGASTYQGNGTGTVFIARAMKVNNTLICGSDIPTVAATATRNADVINNTAVSGLIGQTEGTLYAEVDVMNFAAAGIFLSISDATSSNRVQLYKFTDSKIYADRISATQSALTSISTSALSIGIYKVAFAYSSGNSALFINGVQIGSNALQTFTFGAMGKINIGSRFDDTQIINDRIRAAALYTTRLSNAQLQSLTTL